MAKKTDLILPVDNNETAGEYDLDITVSKYVNGVNAPVLIKDSVLHVFPKLYDVTTNNSQYWNVPGPVQFSMADGIVTLRSQFVQGMYVSHVQNLSDYEDNEIVVFKFLVRSRGPNRFLMALGDGTVSIFETTSDMIDNDLWVWLEFHFDDKCWYLNGRQQTQNIQSTTAVDATQIQFFIMVAGRMSVQISDIYLSSFKAIEDLNFNILDLEGTFKVVTTVNTTGQGLTVAGTSGLDAYATFTVGVGINYGSYELSDYEVTNYLSGFVLADDSLYYRVASTTSTPTWQRVDLSRYTDADITLTSNDDRIPVISYSPYVYQLPEEVINGNSIDSITIPLDTIVNPVTITPTQNGTKYGHVLLDISLTDYEGEAVTVGSLTISYDNTTDTVEITDGTASFNILSDPGNVEVTLDYTPAELYNESSTTYTVSVEKQTPTITMTDIEDIYIGDSVTVNGVYTDEFGDPISGATIPLYISTGDNTTVTTNSSGEYTYTFTPDEINSSLTVRAYTDTNTYYTRATIAKTFQVLRRTVQLTLDPISNIIYGDSVTISGSLLTDLGVAMADTTLWCYVQGSRIDDITTDSNGEFSVTYTPTAYNSYIVRISFLATDVYSSAYASTTFTVKRLDTSIDLDSISDITGGESVEITGYIYDENADELDGASIILKNVTSGGTSTIATVVTSEGLIYADYTPTTLGTNIINAVYSGDSTHSPCIGTTGSFVVNAIDTSLSVDSILSMKLGDSVTISGALVDDNGDAIPNATVSISCNDDTLTATTNSTGAYSISYTPSSVELINVTVEYTGTGYYSNSSASTSFYCITPIETDFTLSIPSPMYVGTAYTIPFTLEEVSTGDAMADATVTVTVSDGTTATLTTDSTGLASFIYTPSASGSFTLSAVYSGDRLHNGTTTGSQSFTVSRRSTTLTSDILQTSFVQGELVPVNGQLLDNESNAVSGATISVSLGGGSSTATTDTDGYYECRVLPAGDGSYTATATYAGSTVYISSSDTTSFTVASPSYAYSMHTTSALNSFDGSTLNLGYRSINTIKQVDTDTLDEGMLSLTFDNITSNCYMGFMEYTQLSDNSDGIGRTVLFRATDIGYTGGGVEFNFYDNKCYVCVDGHDTGIIYDFNDWNNVYLYGYGYSTTDTYTICDLLWNSSYDYVPEYILNPQSTPSHTDPLDLQFIDRGQQYYSNKYLRYYGEYIDSYGNTATETSITTVYGYLQYGIGSYATSSGEYDVVKSTAYSSSYVIRLIRLINAKTDTYNAGFYDTKIILHSYCDELDYDSYTAGGGATMTTGTLTATATSTITDITTSGFTMTNTYTIPELDAPMLLGYARFSLSTTETGSWRELKDNNSYVIHQIFTSDDNTITTTLTNATYGSNSLVSGTTYYLRVQITGLGNGGAFTSSGYYVLTTSFTVP